MQLNISKPSILTLIQIGTALFSAGIVVAAILYVVNQNIELKKEIKQLKSGNATNQNIDTTGQIDTLLQSIGKVIDLPANEQPTVATILDSNPLKTNPFFIQAQDGDKVIVYKNAGKAFLYRPSTNKVIETGSFQSEKIIESNTNSLGVEEQGNFRLQDTPTNQVSSSSGINN